MPDDDPQSPEAPQQSEDTPADPGRLTTSEENRSADPGELRTRREFAEEGDARARFSVEQ